MARKYVVTGGPGFGKTTLLNELQRLGRFIVPEAARLVASEHPALNKSGTEFQGLVFRKQVDLESRITGDVAFLDRGVPDSIAYAARDGYGLPPEIELSLGGASYETVFLLGPIAEKFYKTDGVRRESYAEALRTHELLLKVYDEYGFDVVVVGGRNDTESKEEALVRQVHEISQHMSLPSAEVEGKYSLDWELFHSLKAQLDGMHMVRHESVYERNVQLNFNEKLDTVRVRYVPDAAPVLTFKGVNTGVHVNERQEVNIPITEDSARTLEEVLGHSSQYEKCRLAYTPLGDKSCSISLDVVEGRPYLEIEAKSERVVEKWKRKLGITAESIRLPYHKLIEADAHLR